MNSDEIQIIVEQNFNATIKNVWNAITELDQMKQWFFQDIPSFSTQVGFKTQFVVQVETRIFTHLWEITTVIPYKKISYNWKYKEFTGDSFVTFELVELQDSVKLRLTHTVVESFPNDIPEFSRESGLDGWNYFISKRLKDYLEGA